MNPILTKSYRAAGVITGCLIVAWSGDEAAVASDPTGALIGAADSMGAVAVGDMLDVVKVGVGEVRCGGNIVQGDPLTTDANGKAVKATPSAGDVIRIIGFAERDGEAEDIIPYLAAPGLLATPAA